MSSVIEATAPLRRPVSADKALAASEKLQVQTKKGLRYPQKFKRRWGTVAFMAGIHVLTLIALLPRFWSFQNLAALLILYWVTA